MRKLLFFLVAMFFASQYANAEDFYWKFRDGEKYPTPRAACQPLADKFVQSGDKYIAGTIKSIIMHREDVAECIVSPPSGYEYAGDGSHMILRGGDGCTAPKTYNSQTGSCDEPEPSNKCESRAGQQRKFQKSGTIGDGWFSVSSNGYGLHPQDNCVEGCQAWTEGVQCKYNNLIGNVYLCRGTANLTGAECGTGGGDAVETDDNTLPEPERVVDKKPCVYKTNADGTQTCESESSDYKDGQHCAQGANGKKVCVDKAPEKNGIDIRTKIETKPTPDGGSQTTKTDVTTKTECKNGTCTSSTTTRTTTTTKDADGKVKSVSGACTGKDCKDKNEDPDGEGDGNGTCTGANCSDDPFDEGIGDGGFYEPGEDTFESVLTAFQSGVTQLPVIDGVGNFLAFSPSGSCPTGSTTVWVFTIQGDQWCGNTIPWDLIKAVIMGIAAFLAFRIAFL